VDSLGGQSEAPIEERLRRLITLIFAGRNRIIVIRRELPRTRSASLAKGRSHRTFEDSPFRVYRDGDSLCPPHLIDSPRNRFLAGHEGGDLGLLFIFDLDSDSPDKAQ
jgi:hypothetical protein